MNDYWKNFWQEHASATTEEHAQYQVLRTLNKKPIPEEQFQQILESIAQKIQLAEGDIVLDLCCGNGLITTFLSSRCRSVVGVDYAEGLIANIDLEEHKNISVVIEDITRVSFPSESFDKIVLYAGLQYLTERETVLVFENAMKWLKTGGLFFVADVPDRSRMWNFFNSQEREGAYYDSLKKEEPIVGNWFEEGWLSKLAIHVGFVGVEALQQPVEFPYAHYRFDLLMRK